MKKRICNFYQNVPRVFNIKTVFYNGKQIVKVNHSAHAVNAVPRSVYHMQLNRYNARTAEVFDKVDGTLHAVISRSIKGNINIVFKREMKADM